MLRSKRDIYEKLRFHCQFFLPQMKSCSIDFLRAVLKGDKQLIPMRELRKLNSHPYKEFSVGALLPEFYSDEDTKRYLADGRVPDRDYLHGVLATLHHDRMHERIEDAIKTRNAVNKDLPAERAIEMLPSFVARLKELGAKPRTVKGRGVYLLAKRRPGRPPEVERSQLKLKRKAPSKATGATPAKWLAYEGSAPLPKKA